jgi:hypothetical protein
VDSIHLIRVPSRRYHPDLGHRPVKLLRCRVHWPGRITSPNLRCQDCTRRVLQLPPRLEPVLPQPLEQTTRRCHFKAQGSHKVQLDSAASGQIRRLYSHKVSPAKVKSAAIHSHKEAAHFRQENWITSSAYRKHPRSPTASFIPAYDSSPTGPTSPISASAISTTSTRATS